MSGRSVSFLQQRSRALEQAGDPGGRGVDCWSTAGTVPGQEIKGIQVCGACCNELVWYGIHTGLSHQNGANGLEK